LISILLESSQPVLSILYLLLTKLSWGRVCACMQVTFTKEINTVMYLAVWS
jgi:hypothetical protein